MKQKITLTITALVLVAALSTMAAFATGNGSRGFVDADNDGICDNQGNGNFVGADNDGICDNQGYGNFVDADNDGVCDNRGNGNGNFVDVDNDGVCDNRGTGVRPQDGTGRQWGRNK